jgi:hypothetical protein
MKSWNEMFLIKHNLNKTMIKIEKIFEDVSSDCEYYMFHCGRKLCTHKNTDRWTKMPFCESEVCPIIKEGVNKLELEDLREENNGKKTNIVYR